MYHPFIIGAWDGSHLWLQWLPVFRAKGYLVRVRYRQPGRKRWGAWIRLGAGLITEESIKVPAHSKGGWEAQAQVKTYGEKEWKTAKPAEFARASCEFEFVSRGRKVTFQAGETIHCIVKGESCAYRFREGFELPEGGKCTAILKAVRSAPGNRLQRAGDFRIAPAFDLEIRNVGPSENDVAVIVGESAARIHPLTPDGEMTAAFGRLPRRLI
jgi:hypothetical protein